MSVKLKKPPDKYRILKIPIKHLIKDDIDYSNLKDCIKRTNKLVIHVYQFLRLWILKKYHNNKDIPYITIDIIKMAFKALSKESNGPKPKGENLKYYNKFCKFYDTTYNKLHYKEKIDAKNLSAIINYMCVDMMTNINNNIKLHFIDYIKRFVNSYFKNKHLKILKKYKEQCKKDNTYQTDIKDMNKKLRQELYILKQDLLNNTTKSDTEYCNWLNKYRDKILPKKPKQSYQYDINKNPQSYIKYMIYMNIKLQKKEGKMFQFFPLRKDIKPHYIPIDTKSIIEIFDTKDKKKYLFHIEENKNMLWDRYFNIKHKIFKQKNYLFDYRILTDGYAVSIQFIHKDEIKNEIRKKENMKNAKKKYKGLSKDEKEYLKNENKECLKKDKNRSLLKTIKQQKYIEFPYLDEIDKNELKEVKKAFKIYVDPGKRTLLYMMGDNGKTYKYNNRKHMFFNKRFKYQKLIHNFKHKIGILKIENKLSNYNSKSCDFEEFQKFIKIKNRINDELFNKYNKKKFRKYRWYSYINKQRTKSKMINEIKKKFCKNCKECDYCQNGNDCKKCEDCRDYQDCKIIYGDWNITKQMRNFISTPGIGIKRTIAKHFKVYNLDEFRTSCLNHKTEEKCENLYLPDKKGFYRKIHSILTFKMENNRYGCINRDLNSVRNMQKITNYWFKHKERPLKYRHNYDLTTNKLKGTNPFFKSVK